MFGKRKFKVGRVKIEDEGQIYLASLLDLNILRVAIQQNDQQTIQDRLDQTRVDGDLVERCKQACGESQRSSLATNI